LILKPLAVRRGIEPLFQE